MSAATEKQKNCIFAIVSKRFGRGPRDYIDAKIGKAMGLSMRERSGAGKLGAFVDELDKAEASQIIDRLKG